MLITCRLDRVVARPLLPSALRPQLVGGRVVAGINLLRLDAMRCAAFNRAGLSAQIGWSPTRNGHCLQSLQSMQSLQLDTDSWRGMPARLSRSSPTFSTRCPRGRRNGIRCS